MELNDLSTDERVALVALIELVVEANAAVTEEESEAIDDIVDELGPDVYAETVEEVGKRFPDEDALRAFLQTITRQDARELVYGTVIDVAVGDAIRNHESNLLEWLGATWNVKVEYDAPPK